MAIQKRRAFYKSKGEESKVNSYNLDVNYSLTQMALGN